MIGLMRCVIFCLLSDFLVHRTSSYYNTNTPGLHFPLMALIDYRGFRLVAISILPISRSTILYGSADGGATIHCDDPGTFTRIA